MENKENIKDITGVKAVAKELVKMPIGEKLYVVIASPEEDDEFTELAFIVKRDFINNYNITVNGYEDEGSHNIGISDNQLIKELAGLACDVVAYIVKQYCTDPDTGDISLLPKGTKIWTEPMAWG